MNIFEIVIKCISWINYATASNSTVGMRKRLVNFIENAFLCFLPEKISTLLINNHLTLNYLNYVIRKSKISNEKEELIDTYTIVKEGVRENNRCRIINEDSYVTENKCYEQIEYANDTGKVLGIFIKSILNILNIMNYSNYDEGKKGLIKCAKWNHIPSMIILSYIYNIEENYIDSLYWLELVGLLNPNYITQELNIRMKKIKKELSDLEYNNLFNQVINDNKIHNLLYDDRVNCNISIEKVNSSIINVLYSPILSFKEKEKLLFNECNIRWNLIEELINNTIKTNNNLLKEDLYNENNIKYYNIFNTIKQSINNNKIVVINYSDELQKEIVLNKIKEYIYNYNYEIIDSNYINQSRFKKEATEMNIFYNLITKSKKENFFIIFDMFKNEYNELLYDLMNPREKYYFNDLDISILKEKMISIVFVNDLNLLPKYIFDSCKILALQEFNKEEKINIIKEIVENKKKNFSLDTVIFKDDVYEYFNNMSKEMIDIELCKILKKIETEEYKQIGKKEIELICKKNKTIGFI